MYSGMKFSPIFATEPVMDLNLFMYCSNHLKEEFKQFTKREKQNEEIY